MTERLHSDGGIAAETGIRKTSRPEASAFARLPQGILQRKCSCGGSAGASGTCKECEEEKKPLQRSATGTPGPVTAPPVVHETIRQAGRPLDRETGARMESAFGHNFASVRVHTGGKAAESARAVSALAYTVGESIVFGAGQFAPHTPAGGRLLAHELAHVVQQRSGAVTAASEQELETAAETRAAQVSSSGTQGRRGV